MTEGYDYREHLAEIKRLKKRYGKADTCAACGIIRERLPVGTLKTDDNGVCCVACLEEYPELEGKSRDEVALWLWEHWRIRLNWQGGNSGQAAADVARIWLRMQVSYGRTDESMADVAAAAYGLGQHTRDKLRRYVRQLAKREGAGAS